MFHRCAKGIIRFDEKQDSYLITQTMTHRKKTRSDWLLTRQRFHITDPLPPAARTEEKLIGSILSDLLDAEPPVKTCPDVLIERWPLIVGAPIAKHTFPTTLDQRILTVDADHPGWLAEIRRLPKQPLLKKISVIPGLPELSDIRFRLDPSIWKRQGRSV